MIFRLDSLFDDGILNFFDSSISVRKMGGGAVHTVKVSDLNLGCSLINLAIRMLRIIIINTPCFFECDR